MIGREARGRKLDPVVEALLARVVLGRGEQAERGAREEQEVAHVALVPVEVLRVRTRDAMELGLQVGARVVRRVTRGVRGIAPARGITPRDEMCRKIIHRVAPPGPDGVGVGVEAEEEAVRRHCEGEGVERVEDCASSQQQ